MVSNYKFVDDKTLAYSYSGNPTEFLQQVLDVEATETNKDTMVFNNSVAECELMLWGKLLKILVIFPYITNVYV